MRTIKFRGKRLDNKDWVYGYLVPVVNHGKTQMHIVTEIRGGSIQGSAVDHETIGQYTGMPDKNGNEVYEGDIVRYRTTDERYTRNPNFRTLIIHYEESSACFQAGEIYWDTLRSAKVEVVGNSCDNPIVIHD